MKLLSGSKRVIFRCLSLALLAIIPIPAAGLGTQTAPPVSQWSTSVPKKAANPASRRLTDLEQQTLKNLFAKIRPATLRLEDCPLQGSCEEPNGVGSGFLISADGLALTAYHVVFESENLQAVTLNKRRYPVEVIGFDDQHDVALLKVKVPAGTPFLPLASVGAQVNETALVVGNGNGQFLRSSFGRLLSLQSDPKRADFPPGTLELSAQLVPGDSGGPVLNARGEVMGVVSFISLDAAGGPITSYAVPVTSDDAVLADLKRGVKREAAIIGVSIMPELSSLDAEQFAVVNHLLQEKLGTVPGAFFQGVSKGSPAEAAGLQPFTIRGEKEVVPGDIVTAVNGKRILNFSEFQYAVRAHQPGETVTLTILRGGKEISVKLKLVGRSSVGRG